MIFQTHDLIHPNQIRLNKLIDSYDKAYIQAQKGTPDFYDSSYMRSSAVDVYDVLEYRTAYDVAH